MCSNYLINAKDLCAIAFYCARAQHLLITAVVAKVQCMRNAHERVRDSLVFVVLIPFFTHAHIRVRELLCLCVSTFN